MKGYIRLLMVLAALCPLGAKAQGIADVVSRLRTASAAYDGTARFAATLPNAPTDVVYELEMATRPAAKDDTLGQWDYLISWEAEGPNGPTNGFTAYHDGSHYRFRDNRLQEYHAEWDEAPLRLGVQHKAQFVNLLPPYVADEIERLDADTCTVLNWRGDRLRAVTTIQGCTAMEREYEFDPATGLPRRIVTESSPGTLAEQTIEVTYGPAREKIGSIDEQSLSARFPDAFGRYRECNFRVESLAGEPLPAIALPRADGSRYTRHRGDAMQAPTVVALIDPSTQFAEPMVQALRQAVDELPYNADLVLAMATTNADLADEAAGHRTRPGESLLLNARALARDCGAASLPVVLLVSRDGTVQNVIPGFNNDLSAVVLQKMALLE